MRTKPVALRREVPLEYRLQHGSERRLHHPVAYRRNPQRALFLAAQLRRSSAAAPLAVDSYCPPANARAFPGLLPGRARTLPPSHGPRLPPPGSPSRVQRLAAGWAARTPCQSAGTTCLLSLPVREPSAFVPSKPSVPPSPNGLESPPRLRFSGLLSRFRHCRRSCSAACSVTSPPSCVPSLQAHYRPFVALMDALTPARPTLLGPSQATNGGLLHEQVSLIHAPGLPTLPSPTTCGRSASSGHVTPRRVEPRSLPHGSSPNGNSGLRHSLAGSPHLTGRIEFLSVRTGRSPPAAPHPVSPRRSCRPITSYVDLERTFTPPTRCALRRTNAAILAAPGRGWKPALRIQYQDS